ncbi:hypothetical protein T492DRAFT_552068 [Pavlovales sp. CCMP2436]|nr:hypothetical protein T492DRAFT_552068 [Pavlovales sp. CCMP2436]
MFYLDFNSRMGVRTPPAALLPPSLRGTGEEWPGLVPRVLGADSLRSDKQETLLPRCNASVDGGLAGEWAAGTAPEVPIELAVEAARCADMGPLLLERAAFFAVGGFNESMAARGHAGSVGVDCELEARLWLRGMATVCASPQTGDGVSAWARAYQFPGVARHVAWRQRGMGDAHEWRLSEYGHRFQQPGSAQLALISQRVLATNALLSCPPAEGWRPHAPADCLIHPLSTSVCALLDARSADAAERSG